MLLENDFDEADLSPHTIVIDYPEKTPVSYTHLTLPTNREV